jgi:hypothetical protein
LLSEEGRPWHLLYILYSKVKVPKASRERELETLLLLCVALVVLFFITQKQHVFYLTLSVMLGLIGMFSRLLTSKISWAWLKLGEIIGSVMSKFILSAVFFLFLLPVAMLSRIFSKNRSNLQLKKTDGSSYYATRNHRYQPKDLENVW